MAFFDVFSEWKVSVSLKRKTSVFDQATGETTNSEGTIGSYSAIVYTGAAAERLVSEKIRPSVSAVVVFDATVSAQVNDIVVVSSKRYNIIYVDDVAFQSEVKLCALGELT